MSQEDKTGALAVLLAASNEPAHYETAHGVFIDHSGALCFSVKASSGRWTSMALAAGQWASYAFLQHEQEAGE